MNRKMISLTVLVISLVLLVTLTAPAQVRALAWRNIVQGLPYASPAAPAAPVGNAFTYQGQLQDAGGLVTDFCDFQFGLWDESTSGNQIGSTQTQTNTEVTDGLFMAQLDFGPAFDGNARWLEIAVRCPAGSGDYNTLSPRQELTPAPNAMNADMLDGQHAGGFAISGHAHWGETWSGSGTGLTLEGGTTGLIARGSGMGVWGESSDPFGAGVIGFGNGSTTGVRGMSQLGNPLEAYGSGEDNRLFYVDIYGQVYAMGAVPLLPRANAPQDNTFTTLDSTGDVGRSTSATIGVDGLPLISYFDYNNQNLKVAHCRDVACAEVDIYTIDNSGNVADYGTSIAIGADGAGVIVYIQGGLVVAHCTDIACSSASSTRLYAGDAQNPSVAIGRDGLPLISYAVQYPTYKNLEVAHCADAACTSATITSLTTLSGGTSITIGADGLGLISIENVDVILTPGVCVNHCNNVACTGTTEYCYDTSSYYGLSMTTGADGLGFIAHSDDDDYLVVGHCDNASCSSVTTTTVDSTSDVRHPSVTIGADGYPLISYYDATAGVLNIAHCATADCSKFTILTLASSSGSVGQGSSVTIGVDGLPLISYYDITNGNLRVVHCSNRLCVPYFRPR